MADNSQRYRLHHFFNNKDEVLGSFEVKDGEVHFATNADKHNCDIIPPGPISQGTKTKINRMIDNHKKSMWLEKI
jgi:hypothetical protein